MASAPEYYHLDAVRKLRGEPLITFPENDTAYPRIERIRTTDRGAGLGTPGTTKDKEYDGTGGKAECVLVEQRIVGFSTQGQEVFEDFERIPGKTTTVRTSVDLEAGIVTVVTRTKKKLSDIVEGSGSSGSSYVYKKESEGIDGVFGWEVETRQYASVYTAENPKVESEMRPYAYPGYMPSYGEYVNDVTYTAPDFFGADFGVRQTDAYPTKHRIKTWFVIADTEPDIPYDELAPQSVLINGKNHKVLHDSITRIAGVGFAMLVTFPATVPSFTQYFGAVADLTDDDGHPIPPPDPLIPSTDDAKWIGKWKIIGGSCKNAGHPKLWRLQTIEVVMK